MKDGITGVLSGEGWERVMTVNADVLECEVCGKILTSFDVVFWCKTKHVHCEDCAKNLDVPHSCRVYDFVKNYGKAEQNHNHEHIRASLRLQAPKVQ